ncbi:MAG: hypothetical protein A2033_14620 [Bacteroidetes bacterium GWA2_31_9]|nr:MAG: hypothetical protein A2033_14620 [Bacteroidetes bacterium GWA2_31_9]
MRNIRILAFLAVLLSFSFTAFPQTNENFEIAKTYLENKGEVYFKFVNPGINQILNLTKVISIDNVDNEFVYAYANSKEFDKFLTFNIQYEVLDHPGDLKFEPKMFDSFDKATMAFDAYPTYDAYVAMMYQFESDYPDICKIYDIGTTVDGRKLLFAKITDSLNVREHEPRFMYTSTMHGDETTGYVTMLHLIDYLLSNYGMDSRITNLIDNMEIWINPLENPDGTYNGGNNTVDGSIRNNGNNEDLNRNYKNPVQGDHPDGASWQPEALAMMGFTDTLHFVMSANFHGGEEVVNYPWDSWSSSQRTHADDLWYKYVCHLFADTVHANSPSTYMDDSSPSFDQGITNGADWYFAFGTRQDYMNYYRHCREITLEVSNTKTIPASELLNHWNYLYPSLINYIEQATYGVNGVVTDSLTGDPLYAHIFIQSHDVDSSDVFTELPMGDYYRPLLAGSYDITYSSNGYISKTFNVNITNSTTTVLDVQLARTSIPPVAGFTAVKTNYCSAPVTVQFVNSTVDASSYLWDFGDGNTSTEFNPTHIYDALGTYTVSLSATGYGGTDNYVITDYIFIDLSNPCEFSMLTSGTDSSTNCEGILYDSGNSYNYQDYTNSTYTISPAGASSITLTFSEFSFEDTYDFLYVYDGPNTASTLIGVYSGTNLPNGGTITTTSGSVTFKQTSDQNTNGSGFVLNWACSYPTTTPIPDFTSNKTQTCDGIIEFNDLSTQGPVSWFWNFGDGTNSVEQNPIHIFTQNGVFDVKLIVTNAFGSDSITKLSFITVDMPIAPTTTSDSICGSGNVNLSASGAGTLNWYLDEVSDSIINIGTSFQTPTLISSTNYYVSSLIDNPIQNVGSVDYNANGGWHTSGTYYNMFDVYKPLEIVSVFVKKQNAGNVTVALLSSTGAVLQSITNSVLAGTSRINLNFIVEPGTNYGLKVTNATNLWRNNNGVTMPYEISGLIGITTTNAGSNLYYYLYDWEVREAACESPRTIVSAIINDIPILNLGNDENTCEGMTAQITAPLGYSYLWSTGSTLQTINVTISGDYSLTITDSNMCSNSDTINVNFNTLPVVTLGNDTSICDGSNLLLDAGSWSSYLWSNLSTSQSIQVSNQGNFAVMVTDANSCSNSDTINVSINSLPVVNLGNDTSICEGTSLTFDAGSWSSYLWSNLSTSQSIQVNNQGSFSVIVTDANSCSNSDTINVSINSLPAVNLGNDTSICEGTNLTLDAGSGFSYLWSNSSTLQTLIVNSPDVYQVTITDNNNCSANNQISIMFDSLPVADFSYVVNNGEVVFTNLSVLSDTYDWNFGNGTNSSQINPSVIYTSSNLYLVSLTASNSCGWDSIEKNINVIISGINDFSSSNIKVYPNPASNKLNIDFNENFKLRSLVISDITGKVVLKKTYNDNYDLLELDLSGIKSGVYVVELNKEIENIVFRLIID